MGPIVNREKHALLLPPSYSTAMVDRLKAMLFLDPERLSFTLRQMNTGAAEFITVELEMPDSVAAMVQRQKKAASNV